MSRLLTDKTAIIYGAGGGLGGGVARTFAREGARVFLAGRTREPLEAVAADIEAAGGGAEVAVLDALDERAVDDHAGAVAAKAGGIDISFNLVTRGDVQGIPLFDMAWDDLARAVDTGLKASFVPYLRARRHGVARVQVRRAPDRGRRDRRDHDVRPHAVPGVRSPADALTPPLTCR